MTHFVYFTPTEGIRTASIRYDFQLQYDFHPGLLLFGG